MTDYWITFTGRGPACVTAPDEDEARRLATEITGAAVTKIERLPYPAEPRLNRVPIGEWGVSPSFCYRPTQCAGHSSCPQRMSCTD